MPKRRIDPTTGEPELTYREQLLVDEYIRNGGNGAQAAAAAGYTAARLDQAAYQVLHRQRVQQHIRERIRESRVSADEIIGTVASHMRGDLTEFFDESGNFSIQVARAKGIGHLLPAIAAQPLPSPQPRQMTAAPAYTRIPLIPRISLLLSFLLRRAATGRFSLTGTGECDPLPSRYCD